MEIFRIIPIRSIYDNRLDPPYDMNGRVIPVIGRRPIVIEIFWICWNISIPTIPNNIYLSVSLIFLLAINNTLISKYTMIARRITTPIKPKFDANTAKIKSVEDSGKYIGVLLKPCPNIPADPIAAKAFSNWRPEPFFQANSLSSR